MEFREFLKIVKEKKQTIFTVCMFFLILTIIFTFAQPLEYGSESKILVYQDNTDPYAMSKSGQFLSSLLTNVIITNNFYEEVVNSGYNIDVLYFSTNEEKRLAIWKSTVKPSIVDDSGVFKVSVFHVDRYQAEQISQAINYVLKTKHNMYHGAGDKVTIKIVDSPIISNYPVRPRFFFNFYAGIVCGIIFSFLYIYLFPEDKYSIRIFPKAKEKKSTINFSRNKKEEEKRYMENDRLTEFKFEKAQREQLATSIIKNKAKSSLEPISLVGNINEKIVDIEDIEKEASISNVIGFSNLGY